MKGQEPMLLYANRHDIRMMGVHSRHHQSLIDNLRSAVAIDYDYSESKIYWSDVASEKIMWYEPVIKLLFLLHYAEHFI
jgi:very low-density lipoprotein receptor